MAHVVESRPITSAAREMGASVWSLAKRRLIPSSSVPEQETHIVEVKNTLWTGFAGKEMTLKDAEGVHTIGILDLSNCTHRFVEGNGGRRQVPVAGPHAVLPLGPVETGSGHHQYGSSKDTQFLYFASIQGVLRGKDTFEARFGEGFDPDLNRAYAGGIAIDGNAMKICDLAELTQRYQNGQDVAQTMYSARRHNFYSLTRQKWDHNGKYQKIADSPANYCGHLQNEDGTQTFFFGVKTNHDSKSGWIRFKSMEVIANELLPKSDWRLAVSVFGMGGGFLVRYNNQDRASSRPLFPNMYHTNPFYLVAKPR